jgi:hypothetical protein
MSRFKTALLTLALVALLFIGALLVILFIQLPSVGDIHAQLARIEKPVAIVPPPISTGARPLSEMDQGPTPVPSPSADLTPAKQNTIIQFFVNRYVQDTGDMVRICENLSGQGDPPPRDAQAFTNLLVQAANGEVRDNPYLDSALAPLGAALRRPTVSVLVNEVLDARAAGNESTIDKMAFYSELASAAAEIFTAKQDLERIAQQAYHLNVISRAVNLQPQLATDQATLQLCDTIQASINNPRQTGPISETRRLDELNNEKTAVLRFLAYAGLAPEQVGYDPNLNNTIRIEASPSQLALHVPWFEKVYGTKASGVAGSSAGSVSATTVPLVETPTPAPSPVAQ